MIESFLKFEFTPDGGGPIVLVDKGGDLAAPPRFTGEGEIFETGGVAAATAYFKPLGGVLTGITLQVILTLPDYAAAMEAFVDPETAGDVPLLNVAGALAITGGNTVATYARAIIRIPAAGLPSGPDARALRTYQITAGLPVVSPILT